MVLEWENGRMIVDFGRESGRSFPFRRLLEALSLMSVIGFIPADHAERGVSLQVGMVLLIELDW